VPEVGLGALDCDEAASEPEQADKPKVSTAINAIARPPDILESIFNTL
jgi:hypothetical protein